jgi:hypothetical protein
VTDGLDLATLGLRVFPVKQGTKEPAIVDYQERATCDPEAILAWGDSHGDGNLGMMIDPGYFV